MALCGTATDVAGEIVEVGQGAKKFKVGDKVVVLLSHFVSAILFLCLFLIRISSTYKIHVLGT